MLKLLLREDRYDLREEYFLRLLAVVVSILIGAAVVWGTILVAPYLQVFVEKDIVEAQLEEIRSSDVTKDRKKLEAISVVVNEKLEVLGGTAINASEILRFVIEDQAAGIRLNTIEINFTRSEGEEGSADAGEEKVIAHIEVHGVADTRSNLVALQKILAEKDIFEAVNIPYSNFTTNENIPFTINVVSVELIKFLNDE